MDSHCHLYPCWIILRTPSVLRKPDATGGDKSLDWWTKIGMLGGERRGFKEAVIQTFWPVSGLGGYLFLVWVSLSLLLKLFLFVPCWGCLFCFLKNGHELVRKFLLKLEKEGWKILETPWINFRVASHLFRTSAAEGPKKITFVKRRIYNLTFIMFS